MHTERDGEIGKQTDKTQTDRMNHRFMNEGYQTVTLSVFMLDYHVFTIISYF